MRLAVLATLSLVAIQCGPNDQEIAASVLIASPGALAFGILVLAGLFKRYRRRHPAATWRQKPATVGFAVSVAVALVTAIATSRTKALETAMFAIWLFGTSYVTLLALTWRVWVTRNAEAAFTWAWLPAAVLQIVPAAFVAADLIPIDPVGALWVWPGYFGATTIVALAIAYVQAGRRPRRKKVPAEAPPS